jgi:hypothetical protein
LLVCDLIAKPSFASFRVPIVIRAQAVVDGMAMDMQRSLIGLGLVVLLAGLAWPWIARSGPWIARSGIGRLPGDILIQR